jgi:hypothetical protein
MAIGKKEKNVVRRTNFENNVIQQYRCCCYDETNNFIE